MAVRRAFGTDSGNRMYTSRPSGGGDLVLEELSQAAPAWVDATQQLPFIEPQADGVIGLPRPRLQGRRLAGRHRCESIEVGDDAGIDRLIEGKEPRLVRQQLTDGEGVDLRRRAFCTAVISRSRC